MTDLEPSRSRLALFSLVAAADTVTFPVLGIVLARLDIVSPFAGFGVALIGALPAATGFGLGLLALRRSGRDVRAITAVLLGGAGVMVAFALLVTWIRVPRINDITTDPLVPPEILDPNGIPIPYPARFADVQRDAYPEIQPVRFRTPVGATWTAVRDEVQSVGWTIVHDDRTAGRIQAVARTPVFRFADDIGIRVRRDGAGSVVDLRSRSRVGQSDLGTNARRIDRFIDRVRARLD